MTEGIVGPDWAEEESKEDRALRLLFPEGKLVVVSDSCHDKFRRGGVVKSINWETKRIVVYFIEDGTEIEFRGIQLLADE